MDNNFKEFISKKGRNHLTLWSFLNIIEMMFFNKHVQFLPNIYYKGHGQRLYVCTSMCVQTYGHWTGSFTCDVVRLSGHIRLDRYFGYSKGGALYYEDDISA